MCHKASALRRMDTHSYDHSCILIVSESNKPRDQTCSSGAHFPEKTAEMTEEMTSSQYSTGHCKHSTAGWRQRLRIWNLSCTDSICVSMMQSIWNANEVRGEVYSPRWGALSTAERPIAPQQMKAASSPSPSSWSSRQNPDTRFASPHLLWNTSNTQKWWQRLVNLREYRRQWLPTARFSFPVYFSFLHF